MINGNVQMGSMFGINPTSHDDTQFEIDGNYAQLPTGILDIYVNDNHPSDRLFGDMLVRGGASLDGTVDFIFCKGCPPHTGDRFTFLSYADLLGDSQFSNVKFENWTPKSWSIEYGPDSATLVIEQGAGTPEPSSIALLGAGIAVMGKAARRKVKEDPSS